MQSVRLLGDGWEPHVNQEGERLIYSQPVESGFISHSFDFEILPADLDVLRTDDYRRAALEVIAHTLLQHSTLRGNLRFTQRDFDCLVANTLHTSSDFLPVFIARVNREHNIHIESYIEETMKRRSARN
ncbi:hypothetical protein [Cedecea sp. MMO-103]|uniref:hypothetical protein n=1 Tax=Cedecea sp. MMO-103 TaxID=3081238 RepID=UPI0030166AD5